MNLSNDALLTTVIFLASAVVVVPIFKRLGLASVIGYLVAGSVLGPFGLKLVHEPKNLLHFAEIGVVMLLFLIGLELKPSRLWAMRRHVFGTGSLQLLFTTVLLGGIAWAATMDLRSAILFGLCFSLSSTAFSLQILTERRQINTQFGRMAFAILLFQDLFAIPLLAIVPFLAVASTSNLNAIHLWPLILAGVIVAVLPFVIRPVLRMIAATRIRELFTAATLFLVLGLALLMANAGLSMALGSFIGGILLSDSEYRHQLEADIEPFKGLLLGLFFMAIGMDVNYELLGQSPTLILSLTFGMMAAKWLVVYALGRMARFPKDTASSMASVLPQGGEFAFVIFSVGLITGLFSQSQYDIFNLMIILSMAATPLLGAVNDRLVSRFRKSSEPNYDEIRNENNQVIIAGFGRFGQIVGRTLRTLDMEFTALEQDPDQVEVLRRFGFKVYYGDASRLDLLEASGARTAKFIAVCIDDVESSLRTVEIVREHFPHLKIFARARNRNHVYQLMDLGVTGLFRETYGSSLEMAESVLVALGYPKSRARSTMTRFREIDEATLKKQHKIHKQGGDERQMISATKEATQQLSEAMKADKETPAASFL
jgi:monovalent cation:proton antiporter-2 (CPA2) family protein